jgi:hypothetical protein
MGRGESPSPVRGEIFVEQNQNISAPSGAHIQMSLLRSYEYSWIRFYKYVAPTALEIKNADGLGHPRFEVFTGC